MKRSSRNDKNWFWKLPATGSRILWTLLSADTKEAGGVIQKHITFQWWIAAHIKDVSEDELHRQPNEVFKKRSEA